MKTHSGSTLNIIRFSTQWYHAIFVLCWSTDLPINWLFDRIAAWKLYDCKIDKWAWGMDLHAPCSKFISTNHKNEEKLPLSYFHLTVLLME